MKGVSYVVRIPTCKRREARLRRVVGISLAREQQPDHSIMPFLAGNVEGREAPQPAGLHVSPLHQQQPHSLEMTVLTRHKQRSRPVRDASRKQKQKQKQNKKQRKAALRIESVLDLLYLDIVAMKTQQSDSFVDWGRKDTHPSAAGLLMSPANFVMIPATVAGFP
jgi:Ulp1 family protease